MSQSQGNREPSIMLRKVLASPEQEGEGGVVVKLRPDETERRQPAQEESELPTPA